VARKDGESGAEAVMQFLADQPHQADIGSKLKSFRQRLGNLDKHIVTKPEWEQLEVQEADEASKLGLDEFKFASNEEMLAAIKHA
jgi:hypothetical protein